MLEIRRGERTRYQDRDSQNAMFGPAQFSVYAFRPLDRRDAVSWVEMDCQQKEWSKEVSKELYLSYVALEVVLLPYTYVLIGP